jgi:hypothetical protein
MKQIKVLAFVALATAFFASCEKVVTGEGPTTTTDRTVAQFSAIDVSVPADIYYYTGTEYKVQIQAQQNITNLIETNVSGSTLQIHFSRNNVNIKSGGVRINVTSPNVKSIRISGSGNLNAPVRIEADHFELGLSGSCSAEIDSLITNSFAGSISGNGHIKVKQGSAHDLQIEISGSGDVDMLDVTAANVSTHTSGSGTIKVTATSKLDAHISGSGRVYYKGSPAISSDISGSGGVSKVE